MYFNLSRYPDGGSVVSDYFVYGQLKLPLAKKVESLIGFRLNQNNLEAKREEKKHFEENSANVSRKIPCQMFLFLGDLFLTGLKLV